MRPRVNSMFLSLRVLCLLAAAVLGAARNTLACLAEYRSPDWQVAHSPLVIIGEVEKVEPGRVKAGKTAGRPFRNDDGPSSSDRSRPKPSIATVRIMRVLKGKYTKTHVRIGSGPIRSCSGDDENFGFQVGEQRIFLLPSYPTDGEAALVWGRSIRDLADTELIESRVARAKTYRQDYLDELQKEKPAAHAAAVELAGQMRKAAKDWPAPDRDKKTSDYSKEFKAAAEDLATALAKVDPEAIRAAQAIDWLDDEPGSWWGNTVWRQAVRKVAVSRAAEIGEIEKARVTRLLASAGVQGDLIQRYLAAIEKRGFNTSLDFPPDPPYLESRSRNEKKASSGKKSSPIDENLSTDFIVRYLHYDRGGMLLAYAGDFSAEVLTGLDAKRVKPFVASLSRSSDERLRWLAHQAIGYASGTEFGGLVLDEMVEEGHPYAWRMLAHWKRPKETAPRLAAMIDDGGKHLTPWGVAAMWGALERGECFEPVCIEKAIAALEKLEENPRAKKPETDGSLAEALQRYLAAAKAHREAVEPPKHSAVEYRQWFKDHPAKAAAAE